MNYKEKYEQALERAKDMLAYKEVRQEDMEYLFPELEENKDERIRKGLIKAVSGILKGNTLYGTDVTREEALAWLEKQGEKSNWRPSEEQYKALDYAFNSIPDTELGNYYECVLLTLIEDLHRLEKQGEQESIDYNEELKKCRENPLYFIDKYVKFEERKPAWSKEDERMRKEIIDFLRLPHPQFVGKRDHEKWIDWLEKRGDNKECGDEWEVSTGLYKCIKRMFDGTPENRLLFETGKLYKCIKIHKCVTNNDVAVFESPYWQSVFLTDSIVRKHFIKV